MSAIPGLRTLASLGLSLVSIPALATQAQAQTTAATLFATHYNTQSIHTLSLSRASNGSYTLTESSKLKTCGKYPSWITLDAETETMYCSDEYGWKNDKDSVNGSLTALSVDEGVLTEIAKTDTAPGSGVHNVVYEGEGGKQYLAIAHYSGSAVSTYALPLQDEADPLQRFEFELSAPGTIPQNQDAPHPHQALLDPTGAFVLVPDLGADLVRVFAIDKANGKLNTCPPLNYTLGGGPRHGVFSTASENHELRVKRSRAPRDSAETVLYVAGELNGEVEAFAVSYQESGCLAFKQIEAEVPYPAELPEDASLGEIRLVDSHLYVSVRLDKAFDGNDSIANLALDGDGKFEFQDINTSGGELPRTLAINKAGDLVAVGNQLSSNVAIVERNANTGLLGSVVASLQIGTRGDPDDPLSGLSSIIWDE